MKPRPNYLAGFGSIVWLLVVILPLYVLVSASFQTRQGYGTDGPLAVPTTFTFENYANAISSGFGLYFVNTVIVMSAGILGSSMMADVVEDSATHTGRHSAGLFFSANAFILKCVSGIGVFGAGLILDAVDFPQGAKRGEVPQNILTNLAIFEPLVIFSLSAFALIFLINFPITRKVHQANLLKLSLQNKLGTSSDTTI